MEQAFAQAEGFREEMIGGVKIVSMAPPSSNHNIVKNNVHTVFAIYLKNNTCIPFGDNEKVQLESDSYVIPDFLVLCDRSKLKADGIHGAPDLVVEVLSPKTAKIDRGSKKDLYQRAGVKEYWIIEPDSKHVEVYVLSNGAYVLDNLYRVPAEDEPGEDKEKEPSSFNVPLFPGLEVSLADVFENVSDWGKG